MNEDLREILTWASGVLVGAGFGAVSFAGAVGMVGGSFFILLGFVFAIAVSVRKSTDCEEIAEQQAEEVDQ
jgi:hypothetical protein